MGGSRSLEEEKLNFKAVAAKESWSWGGLWELF